MNADMMFFFSKVFVLYFVLFGLQASTANSDAEEFMNTVTQATVQFTSIALSDPNPSSTAVFTARENLQEVKNPDNSLHNLYIFESILRGKGLERLQSHPALGNIEYCRAGGQRIIYKLARSKFSDRLVALITNCSASHLSVACKLSTLSTQGVTDYFFTVHGIINFDITLPWERKKVMSHLVVNYVESDCERFAGSLPDSVLFESALGEWAGRHFCGICIGDGKLRNIGITMAPERFYVLGNVAYRFPPSLMPIREDYQDFGWGNFSETPFSGSLFTTAATEQEKAFIAEINAGKLDLFSLFEKHFRQYRVDSVPAGAKVYTVNERDVLHEKNLFKPISASTSPQDEA